MQLDEEIRVQPVEQVQPHPPSHPTITYSAPISSFHQSTGEFISPQSRYQIIAPFPRDSSQDQHIYQPRIVPANPESFQTLATHHSISIVSPAQCESPSLSPQSTIRFHENPALLPSTNSPTVPILLSFPEKEPWRRLSKHRLNMTTGTVKRSISTPNVHQAAVMSAVSAGVQYSTDKRRNKLGYHRTSVACGHCRRRKIRCLIAKEDNHGRCSNCIRLKKECNFFPVETTMRRPRSLSKPDLCANEASSSASSPSPRLASAAKISRGEMTGPYTSSLPVTPTIDFHPSLSENGIRHHGNSSVPSGRLSVPHSNAASRRTSVAHTLLSHKADQEYLASPGIEGTNYARVSGYRMGPLSEVTPAQADHLGLDSAYWRLASSPMAPNQYPVYSQHAGIGSMSSLHSAAPSDPEDASWPARMNTMDQGMAPGYSYPAYTTDMEYHRNVPDLYNSASASTASLAPSIPEGPQFGEGRVPSQIYMGSWTDPANGFSGEAPLKHEAYDYYPPTAEPSLIFASPHQSPKYVS